MDCECRKKKNVDAHLREWRSDMSWFGIADQNVHARVCTRSNVKVDLIVRWGRTVWPSAGRVRQSNCHKPERFLRKQDKMLPSSPVRKERQNQARGQDAGPKQQNAIASCA
eukprot:6188131-Pleurochrysis_carterae.AAC.1